MGFTLPENLKLVMATPPVAANGATYDYVSMKNVHKAWIIIQHYGGGGDTDLVLTVNEATTVAGGSATAITTGAEFQIWGGIGAGTSLDALTRQDDAITYTIDTGASGDELVVFGIDASLLSEGFDCIALIDTGGHASNITSVLYALETRYPQATPPSAIID